MPRHPSGAKKEAAPEVKTPTLGFSSPTAQDEDAKRYFPHFCCSAGQLVTASFQNPAGFRQVRSGRTQPRREDRQEQLLTGFLLCPEPGPFLTRETACKLGFIFMSAKGH